MGTCYTYILYEECDWHYRDGGKEAAIEDLKKEFTVVEILAQWNHYIVIDFDKNSPWHDNTHKLKKYCDTAFYYTDTSPYDIKEMEFKQTQEDLREEARKPANRNKKYIDEAFKDWRQRRNI